MHVGLGLDHRSMNVRWKFVMKMFSQSQEQSANERDLYYDV